MIRLSVRFFILVISIYRIFISQIHNILSVSLCSNRIAITP
nr:MAG TPA: hypothetical protein [Bacteriophage sp.]DAR72810.1 MAG TPA: hypothetical protein [Caudoviricetes sp.]